MKFLICLLPVFLVACRSSEPKWQPVAQGYSFPEGPAWDGRNTLYVSNCKSDWLGRIVDGHSKVWIQRQDPPAAFHTTNGLTVGRDGSVYACDFGLGAVLRLTAEGKSEIYAAGYQGQPFRRPNDLAFDPQGHLYFTDPHTYGSENPDGIVYRVSRADQNVQPVATGLDFPNGLAFSADGKRLYVCESGRERIVFFDVTADGALENRHVFVELPGGDPDGINFDVNGNLYVAHFGGGAVIVIAPDGTILRRIPTPGKKPSNVEFGGRERKTLFLTEDETNAVYSLAVHAAGLPLFFAPKAR
ncbi:SMP-30/gluconolactonase/LRE family protein [candidate division KSB1 bacterium]|nr:SMP-30/gluconolactonase/LRE family protein [candidate division KSB1 bacterium]